MGLLLYCNDSKIYISYKIWNQIKHFLGTLSIKHLNNYINSDSIIYLFNNKNSSSFLNNLLLYYENNLQQINNLNMKGVYLLIKQQPPYSYSYDDSNNFINFINLIKVIMINENNNEMNAHVNNIYNLHQYSIINNYPIYIN